MPADVWAIAHRGASHDRPENTLAAFDEALRQGADGFELDVQLSRDGVPVVYHDRTLSRAGGGRRPVIALDLSELRKLRFQGEPIPTLEEVLERYGERTSLMLEIKAGSAAYDAALAKKVASLVAEVERTFVLCFEMAVLDAAAAAAPDLACVLNIKPPPQLTRPLRALLPRLAAISADVRTLEADFAAAVRAEGREVFAWTCNTPAHVDRAVSAGVRAVMSDRPAWLVERLRGPSASGQLPSLRAK